MSQVAAGSTGPRGQPRWTGDLPRATLRGLIGALGAAVLLALQGAPADVFVVDGVCALAVGIALVTLVEGRLAVTRMPSSLPMEYCVLWGASALLYIVAAFQTSWMEGLVQGGMDAAMRSLPRTLREWPALVFGGGVLGLFVSVASVATLRGTRDQAFILAGVLCACILPGALLLALLGTFALGDWLAERLTRPWADADDVARLRRRVAARRLSPVRVWLLAYLGDVAARDVFGDAPEVPRELDEWLARLALGGAEPAARAALAAGRLALPALRATGADARGPVEHRAAALLDLVELCLAAPGEQTRHAVASAWVALEGEPGPLVQAIRAAGQATLEAGDPSAARAAGEQAVLAGRALVAAGQSPEHIRAAITEALLAWATPREG